MVRLHRCFILGGSFCWRIVNESEWVCKFCTKVWTRRQLTEAKVTEANPTLGAEGPTMLSLCPPIIIKLYTQVSLLLELLFIAVLKMSSFGILSFVSYVSNRCLLWCRRFCSYLLFGPLPV